MRVFSSSLRAISRISVAIIVIVLVAVAAGGAIYYFQTSNAAPKKTTVTVANSGASINFFFTPFALALALNTFNDSRVNLNVNVIGMSTAVLTNAVPTGQTEFGMILADHGLWANEHNVGSADVMGVVNFYSSMMFFLAFAPGYASQVQSKLSTTNMSGPFTQQDLTTLVCSLKHQTVAVASAGSLDYVYLIKYIVPTYCPSLVPGTNFNVVFYNSNAENLATILTKGEANASFTGNPFISLSQAQGLLTPVMAMGALPAFANYETSAITVSAAWAKTHTDLVNRMALAIALAMQQAKKNPQAAMTALENYYSLYPKTMMETWMPFYLGSVTLTFNCPAFTNLINFDVNVTGYLTKNPTVLSCNNLYTNTYINSAISSIGGL